MRLRACCCHTAALIPERNYTKLDLLQDLADMGLTGQETILIHSSMKSIGPVDGGADTVLDWYTFY